MSSSYSLKEIIFKKKPTIEYIVDLLEKHKCNERWYIFGGYVRNLLMGISNNKDIDIIASSQTIKYIIDDLINNCRINKLIKIGLDDYYPLKTLIIDSPSEKNVSIDLCDNDHHFHEICDFTINNFVIVNKLMDINIRIPIEKKNNEETLFFCMNDISKKRIRFMLPTNKIPYFCNDHCNYNNACNKCRLIFLLQQVNLVKRLNKFLNKKDLKTGEKLFLLAKEPNFPPYYPMITLGGDMNDMHCCLCHCLFKNPYERISNNCKHKFCFSCLENYLKSNDNNNIDNEYNCPKCNDIISLKTKRDISHLLRTNIPNNIRSRGGGRGGNRGRGGR